LFCLLETEVLKNEQLELDVDFLLKIIWSLFLCF